ncbi:flagellin [Caulobacter sp. 17J65-9]|uniref:flagellin n=1 Tax=Caulobacter sp. 17J65-9 TaxID=2709382 RepID=UPI0013CC6AE7|nr:flagellin [Caulobacter sp. 17J65-9]NEX93694.1 flagellin [Caulobacter sp. 17J65-9]
MTISVHTNASALVALQNLNKTNDQLSDVQNRINTGLKVNGAKDNASVWAVAQGQRADVGALSAVKMSLDRATSISDVAMAAGESISDLLNEIREKVVAAMDTSIAPASRAAYDADYRSLLTQIDQIVNTSRFDGSNILDGSPSIQFLADADGTQTITLTGLNLKVGGGTVTLGPDINSVANATAVLAQLDTTVASVNSVLGALGSQAKQVQNHRIFVSKLTDTLETGIGNLVDADLARESAKLQALQVQQQLGAQALSIANQAPQVILSLFKG